MVLRTVLLLLAVAALIARAVAVVEPLGIDQSLWASAVYGMGRGQTLYVDVWEQRPPAIYLTYLAGFTTLGWTEATVAWLDVIAAVLTTWLLWRLGTALADRTTGAVAAVLFAALTMPAGLYGYGGFLERSVCETFIVVCVGAIALCATRIGTGRGLGWAMAAGAFGGVAALYKPNAAVYLPAVWAWWWYVLPAGQRPLRLAFHPPCTLQHGQRLRGGVEASLGELGFEVTLAAAESHLCCGSAGTYSILQPALARQLRDRKLGHLVQATPAAPDAIVSANIGCIQHLQSGTPLPVRHWVEVVDEALRPAG